MCICLTHPLRSVARTTQLGPKFDLVVLPTEPPVKITHTAPRP